MSELKPCPFCSGTAHIVPFENADSAVICANCSASTETVDEWNTRAEDPRVKELVDALKAMIYVHDRIIDHGEDALSSMAGITARHQGKAALSKWREG